MLKILAACALFAAVSAVGCSSQRSAPSRGAPRLPGAPAAVDPPGLFVNTAASAGITFRLTNGLPYRYPFLQTLGGGCAFLDYNGDGWQDILLLSPEPSRVTGNNLSSLALYRNNHDGTFTDVTVGSGLDVRLQHAQGLAVGDYDNDGYPDLYVTAYGGCRLFHNLGRHVARGGADLHPAPAVLFEDVTAHAGVADTEGGRHWATSAVWGDYDHDGKLDLYVCHYAVWSEATNVECPRPLGAPGLCEPTMYKGDIGRLYRNLGNGRFADATHSAGLDRVRARGLAAAWVDTTGAGNEDLFIANDMDPNALWRNNGRGGFTESAESAGVALGADGLPLSGMGVAVADYAGSGRESLLVTNLNAQVYSLFQNTGSGLFSYESDRAGLKLPSMARSGFGVAFLDYDLDSLPDIVTGNGHVNPDIDADMPGVTYLEPKTLLRNIGGGKFTDVSAQSGDLLTPRSVRGLAVGDYLNTGHPDILSANRNDAADLFRNVSPDGNHWIRIQLVGGRSNRDGAGALVWLDSSSGRQYAECRLGSSYCSSPDKRLTFGLGKAVVVNRLLVRWPSGQRESYRDLRADRSYIAIEGKGVRPDGS